MFIFLPKYGQTYWFKFTKEKLLTSVGKNVQKQMKLWALIVKS